MKNLKFNPTRRMRLEFYARNENNCLLPNVLLQNYRCFLLEMKFMKPKLENVEDGFKHYQQELLYSLRVVHIKFSTDLEEPPMKIFHKDDIEFYMNYDSAFEVIS